MVRQPGAHKKKLAFITSVVIECGSLHISEGIVPVSRLLSNPKTFKHVSEPIVVGRDPISEFEDSCKVSKDVIEPMEIGKLPVILFLLTLKVFRPVSSPSEVGREPTRPLELSSKLSTEPALPPTRGCFPLADCC